MAMALYRAFQVDRSAQQGLLYPVWAADFNFTYGAPLFAYYPPLASYVILALHWIGFDWVEAAKAAATGTILAAGFGMYVYARWLFGERRASLVSAAAYIFAPYLLTDIYERGAIAEALALALLPWLFWAMHHIIEQHAHLWPWLGGFLVALLVLDHNITAMFVLPVLLIYLTLLAWRAGAWRRVAVILVAIGLGLGLSAFYWLPALLERGYTQITSNMLGGIYQPEQHLAPLADLVQAQLAFDYWGPLRFRLSLWQATVASIAILALGKKGLVLRRYELSLLAVILLGIVFVQLKITDPFWRLVPLARFIQFPWRLLGIAALCIALLTGALLTWRRLAGVAGWVVAGILLSVILYGSTALLGARVTANDPPLPNTEVTLEGLFERGRSIFTPFSDFLPTYVSIDTRDLPQPRSTVNASLSPMGYIPSIEVIGDSPNRLEFQVYAEQPITLRFHRFFFPGWAARVDGQRVSSYPSGDLGLLTADIPSGDHHLVVQFDGTPLRRQLGVLSSIFAAAWVIAGIGIRRARSVLVGVTVVIVVFLVLWFARGGIGAPPRQPTERPVSFEDKVFLLGFHVPTQVWHPGDDISLQLYWLAQQVPGENYTVFLHLVTPDALSNVAQNDSWPVLGYSATSRWEPGEVIVDEQSLHLDADIPTGRYWLLAGLYRLDPVRNLTVRQAPQVLPGDRVMLTSIEISEK